MENITLITLLLGVPAAFFWAIAKVTGNAVLGFTLKITAVAYLLLTTVLILKQYNVI